MDIDSLDFEIDLNFGGDCSDCPGAAVKSRVLARKSDHVYRRAFSESKLLEVLPYDLKNGTSYHCISGGDIDSMSYLKHIMRLQQLDYLILSTWCMAMDDVLQIGEWIDSGRIARLDAYVGEWIDSGRIARLDAYVGEIFPGSYPEPHAGLKKIVDRVGGRVAVFRNHSKILVGIGSKFAFAVESSANINTNPRTENTTVTIGRDIFDFYKAFFDDIKSFNRDYDAWKPLNL